MNWTELLTNLGIFTVGSVSITALLAFFGRKLFEQYLQKRLDDHRSQLERERDEFKHQLHLISQEQQIRYTRLHNDRADVIRILFQKLAKMHRSMRFYIFPAQFAGDPSRNEKRAQAGRAANEFLDYFYENEVFFNSSLCAIVNQINDLYRKAWVDITSYDREVFEAAETREPLTNSALQDAEEALKTIETKIPPLKEELKSQFQHLLGVTKAN